MNMQWIIGPLAGALIGYITNSLAIKMLFWPTRPVQIGKITVPFTPGLIPKEKARLAASVGAVISEQLLNKEVLVATLTSEKMRRLARESYDGFADGLKKDSRTVKETVSGLVGEAAWTELVTEVKQGLAQGIGDKVAEAQIGALLSETLLEYAKTKLQQSFFGKLALKADRQVIEPVGKKLEEMINELVQEHAGQIIEKLLEEELEQAQAMPVETLAARFEEKLLAAGDQVVPLYCRLVEVHLPEIMETLRLAEVIRERIESFDILELEEMILNLVQRELNAIIWLGAGLGFIMGFVNVLFV